MKTLFICRANVGRSQVAMAFYDQIHPGQADSAGTIVDNPGERLINRRGAANVIEVMRENGIDISNNMRKQLSEGMTDKYERLVVMAEPDTVPEWLESHPKATIWTVQDPKGQDLNTTRVIVDQIRKLVQTL